MSKNQDRTLRTRDDGAAYAVLKYNGQAWDKEVGSFVERHEGFRSNLVLGSDRTEPRCLQGILA